MECLRIQPSLQPRQTCTFLVPLRSPRHHGALIHQSICVVKGYKRPTGLCTFGKSSTSWYYLRWLLRMIIQYVLFQHLTSSSSSPGYIGSIMCRVFHFWASFPAATKGSTRYGCVTNQPRARLARLGFDRGSSILPCGIMFGGGCASAPRRDRCQNFGRSPLSGWRSGSPRGG